MGYILLWIENLAVSLLLTALAFALVGRMRWRLLAWVIWILLGIFIFLVYLVPTCIAGLIKFDNFPDFMWFYPVLALTISYVVGVICLCIVGSRRVSAESSTAAASTWALGKLALAFGVAVALHLMTFWNLDLAARQQLAALRAEAGALALSVAPPRVPDSDNAALLYEQAAQVLDSAIEKMPKESIKEESQSNEEPPSMPTMQKAWDRWLDAIDKPDFNAQDPELARFLQQQSGVISLLLEATKKPGCYFEHDYNRPSLEMLFPELQAVRQNARLLALDARYKAATGDLRAAMEDINAMFVLAQNVSKEPLLIATLVGCAIDGIAIETLQAILGRHELGLEELDVLKVNGALSYQKLMQRAFRFEEAMRWNALYEIGNMYGLSGFAHLGGPRDTKSKTGISGESFFFRIFLLTNEIESHRWHSDKANELAAKPYYQAKDEGRNLIKDIRKTHTSFTVNMLFPAVEACARAMARGDAHRRIVELALAMCRYRAKNGKYPEKLEELVPNFISFVPIDPYDGKPMRFKISAQELLIYSVSEDGIDDGGTPMDWETRKGDIIFKLPNK